MLKKNVHQSCFFEIRDAIIENRKITIIKDSRLQADI